MKFSIQYTRIFFTSAFIFTSAITFLSRILKTQNPSILIIVLLFLGAVISSVFIDWSLSRRNFSQPIFKLSPGEHKKLIGVSGFFIGWIFLAFYFQTLPIHSLFEIFSTISELFLLFSVFYIFTSILVYRFPHEYKNDKKSNRFEWVIFAIPPLVVWSFVLLVFWPALMSFDSVDQWRQAVMGSIYNIHPVTHTLLIWLISHIWQSPAAVALFQILFLSFTVGWTVATLRMYQVPRWLCVGVSIFASLTPANAIYSITLWKDILYSACILLLTVICLRCAFDNGKWLIDWKNLIGLGAVLFLIASFRHNGILISIGFIPLFILVYWKYKRQITILGISFFICLLLSQYTYFNIFHFDKYTMGEQVFAPIMAKYYTSGQKFSTTDKQLLESISPVWSYDCSNIYATVNNSFNYGIYLAKIKQVRQILIQSIVQNPKQLLAHLYCSSSVLWSIKIQPSVAGFYSAYVLDDIDSIENNHGLLHSESILPKVKQIAITEIKNTNSPQLQWIFWRSGIYLLVFGYMLVVFLLIQSQWRFISVIFPSFLWIISTIFTIINQELRFVYPVVLLSTALWGLAFVKKIPEEINST